MSDSASASAATRRCGSSASSSRSSRSPASSSTRSASSVARAPPAATASAPAAFPGAAAAPTARRSGRAGGPLEGWLDEPADESVIGTKLDQNGWALAQGGIARVEMRVDGRPYAHATDTARRRRRKVKPGYPENPTAASRSRATSPICRRRATTSQSSHREERPRDGARAAQPDPAGGDGAMARTARRAAGARAQPFYFMMMTSGVGAGRRQRNRDAVSRLPVAHAEGRHGGADPLHAHDARRRARTGRSIPTSTSRANAGRARSPRTR